VSPCRPNLPCNTLPWMLYSAQIPGRSGANPGARFIKLKVPDKETSGDGEKGGRSAQYRALTFAGLALSLGWLLIASVVGSFFVGYWLDKKLGTSPWLMLGITALGSTAGFYRVIIEIIRLGKKI
jgi:ATP synthase protein I